MAGLRGKSGPPGNMNAFKHGLAIVQQAKVGRFVVKIDGDGPILANLAGRVAHGSPSNQMVGAADHPQWGNAYLMARAPCRWWVLPRNPVECASFRSMCTLAE